MKATTKNVSDSRLPAVDDTGLEAPITGVNVSVFTIPTHGPESDATLEWDHTTMVAVEAFAAEDLAGIRPRHLAEVIAASID